MSASAPAPNATLPPTTSPLRLMVARWLGIYPAITLLLLVLGPLLLGRVPTPVSALILTAILVPLTQFVVFPLVERLTGGRWVRFPVLHGRARYRMALVVWACTYPLITAVLLATLPALLGRVPLPVVTLVVTLIAVPLQSLVVLPRVMPLALDWIREGAARV